MNFHGEILNYQVMSRIIKLPEDVANRIAAGEVVERPASVLKELVENSLDADAHYIEISLKRGGKELVQVSDDGEGMSPDDVLLAIQRHATSKISSAEDLNAISTFGFRGEALPSIASVSLLEIISRQRNSDTAFRILIDNGEILEQGEISAQPGTTITTTKLFDKIPARKRFLKSDTSELSRCNDVIIRLALANPDVSFRVESDGRETIYLTSCAEYIERIGQIFDDEVLEKLQKIHYESGEYSVFGFVGNRTIHRARSSDEYFFLNGRPIKSGLLTASLHRAFSGLLPPKRYPVAFVYIESPPELVDVNVHPAKTEVRFRREEAVFGAVYRAISDAIGGPAPAKTIKPLEFAPQKAARQTELDFPQVKRPFPGRKIVPHTLDIEREISEAIGNIAAEPHTQRTVEPMPDFLQILDTYIVARTRDGMLIIDQHAAHERVLFEKVMKAIETEAFSGQRLLFPVEIKLLPQWTVILAKFLKKFSSIGFEVEISSSDRAVLHSVPSFLKSGDYSTVFREILQEISEFDIDAPDVFKNFAATVACRAAIKAGQKLSQDDMGALFDSLFACEDPFHCPHGRPTIVKFSREQLEKMFGRT